MIQTSNFVEEVTSFDSHCPFGPQGQVLEDLSGAMQLAAARAAKAAKAEASQNKSAVATAARIVSAADKAVDARAARVMAGNQAERFAHKDHMVDSAPLPSDMANASRDALAALLLNQHNTGLGNNDALFELRYCSLSPAQRVAMIDAAKEELAAEAKATAEAQPDIGVAYRKAINPKRTLYACACCGLLNFESTGDFRRMSLDRLEPLRYTSSVEDMARWERITRAHALTEKRHVEDYYISQVVFFSMFVLAPAS